MLRKDAGGTAAGSPERHFAPGRAVSLRESRREASAKAGRSGASTKRRWRPTWRRLKEPLSLSRGRLQEA